MSIVGAHGRPGRQEYVVCIDSRNRDLTLYPDANDFRLDINFSRGLPVTRISLGSIELPLPQYIIEEEWSNIYLSEGFALIVNSENDLCMREFSVREWDGSIARAVLPIWLNPLVSIDQIGNTAVFTTLFEHGLDLRGEWDWGSPIQIVSTNLPPSVSALPLDNPNLTILSPTTFSLSNVPGGVVLVPNQGYLHAPAIANPAKLASMVSAGLNMSSTNLSYVMEYVGERNQFCLKLASYPCALSTLPASNCEASCSSNGAVRIPLYPGPEPNARSFGPIPAYIISDSTNCLPFTMGFGCSDLALPAGDAAVSKGVCGQFCYQCMSIIRFTPGNYNVETFPAEFATQANRFYFEPTCAPGSSSIPPPTLVFSDECGDCHLAHIPFGQYSPDNLAAALQSAMNSATSSSDYSVVFSTLEDGNGCFTFSTVSKQPFGLEFGDPRNSGVSFIGVISGVREITMQQRLGFANGCYRGGNSYSSNKKFLVPTKGCRCSSIPERFLSNVYEPILNRSRKEFGINSCRGRLPRGTLTDLGNGFVQIDTVLVPAPPAPALPEYAHGYQPEDVVSVHVPSTGDTYQLVVTEAISATSFLAELSGVTDFAGAAGLEVCTSLLGPVILNLFFGSLCNVAPFAQSASTLYSTPFGSFVTQTIRSEITGFPPTAILWEGPSSLPVLAPNAFNLDPPSYLLLQIVEPSESRYIQHRYRDDTISIFAKIIAYPQLRQERAVPQEAIYQGLKIINNLRLRVLTPYHELYNFHGSNWSATLVFTTSSLSGAQTCQ